MNSSRSRPRVSRSTCSTAPLLLLGMAVTLLMATGGCRALETSSIFSWPDSLNWSSRSQSPSTGSGTADVDGPTPVTVGDYVTISGLSMITLEGVGLITGLEGTGGDPPPSPFRMTLLKDMKRRGVRNPKALLRSPKTAMVIVRAYLPPLVRKGERFDVEVRLPSGTEATSLNGGWLMETDLTERAIVPGQGVLTGHIFARARGNVLISHGEGDKQDLAGVLRRGRIPGGGVSRRDRDLKISLRNRFRSVRMSRRIAHQIGERFYSYNRHGTREPLAEPKSDRTIVLKVHPKYRDNFPRYLQVIRQIAMKEDGVARQVRMQQLASQLEVNETAERAALALESIGPRAIPFLKTGLENENLEVQFHAAVALAYLDDNSGSGVLARTARNERAFRVFSLAALATLEDAPSQLLLRELLSPVHACGTSTCQHRGQVVDGACPDCRKAGLLKQSFELQYGAFRALSTRDRLDPSIRGENIQDLFTLHEVDAGGQPLIHLTQLQRAEIVLFGKDQQFRTPLAVQAGNHVWLNAQSGSPTITISRYQVGQAPRKKVVPTRVADVIRTAVEFGATYPDIVQMLVQAQRQHNVPGQIAIDTMPRTGRIYLRPDPDDNDDRRTRLGSTDQSPNLFPTLITPGHRTGDTTPDEQPGESERSLQETPGEGIKEAADEENEVSQKSRDTGDASLADRRTANKENPPETGTASPLSFLKSLFR